MKLELEDLTKDELLRLFHERCWPKPRQHELLFIRWDTLVKQAQKVSEEGSQALQGRDYPRAAELFKRADILWEKANAVFAEGEKLCQKA